MTTVSLASLSAKGWITDVPNVLDFLMAHFYESEYTQSTLYYGKISNLQYLVQKYGGDPDQFVAGLTNTLQEYLGRYFPDGVKLEITHNANDADFDGGVKYNVTVKVQVTRDGQTYSIAETLKSLDGVFETVRGLVNA